jgi:hypothetical protein
VALETRAGAERRHRDAVLVREREHRGDLLGRVREDDGVREVRLVVGQVLPVQAQDGFARRDPPGIADAPLQLRLQVERDHRG